MEAYVEIPILLQDVKDNFKPFENLAEIGYDVFIDMEEKKIIISWKNYQKDKKGIIKFVKTNKNRVKEK